MNASKRQILEFAQSHFIVNAQSLANNYGMNPVTAQQYLSSLAKDNELVRVGQGKYAIARKQHSLMCLPSRPRRCIPN